MKFKRFIACFCVGLFSIGVGLGLSACGPKKEDEKVDVEPNVTLSQNIKTNIDSTVEYLVANVYNKYEGTFSSNTYNTVQSAKTKFGNGFKYYVEVATLEGYTGENAVENVKIGNQEFTKDSTTALSVGNNNFIRDVVWFVEDSRLYVAAPVMAFELVINNKITINNDEVVTITGIETASQIDFENVQFQAGTTKNTVNITGNENEYNVYVEENKWLGFYFDGAQQGSVALTKKVTDWNDERFATSIAYGLTAVENVIGHPVAFYLNTNYGATIDYSVYLVGQGIASAKLNCTTKTGA